MEQKKKKPYSKPEIFFESFQMTTHLSANCEKINTLHSQGTCAYKLGRYNCFTSDVAACTDECPEGYMGMGYEGVCYWTHDQSKNIFNS